MQDNINTILNNALVVTNDNLVQNIDLIIKKIKESLKVNEDLLISANKIDQKNNNGFIMDTKVIDNIFSNIEKETSKYGTVTISRKDTEKGIIYGKELLDIGNVIVINDGNPYVIIEMSLRNILASNKTIFVNSGYMYGTNQLIIKLMQAVLEQFNISKYMLSLFITENYEEVLSHYANIDLVVCIGNNHLQRLILEKSKSKTITSGYENFDLYIEDTNNLDFLNTIINTGVNINLYINKITNLDYQDAILVDDLDEAIAKINYNGNTYSTSIFTSSSTNASRFIKEIKSSIVTVNTSPTIERIIDIKQSDLFIEKTIIYPLNFTLTNTSEKVNIPDENI